jgi:hypothetical protein
MAVAIRSRCGDQGRGVLVAGIKGLIVALSVLAVLLLLYAAQLPQYGDGAIGTVMVLAASIAAYVACLIFALPMAIRAFRRGETISEAAWLCGSIATPMIAWLAIIWWTTRS